MKRFNFMAWTFSLFFLTGTTYGNDDTLIIGTWGGPYEEALQTKLIAQFSIESGIPIDTRYYFGGLDELRKSSSPNVLDMSEEEALIACDEGLIIQLDPKQLIETKFRNESNTRSFMDSSISRCSVAHMTYSTLIAFDEKAFPGEKPRSIADFFNISKFPGKRAIQKQPKAILEWALMAEGVPTSQVYDLLSTERGMRIALKRLNTIRKNIIWWDRPDEAVTLLKQGDVVMASGYNGHFFDAWRLGTPISMIWEGQIIDRVVWAISSMNKNKKKAAYDFIRFALKPQQQASIAEYIPYGPTHKSAADFIGLHPTAGIPMNEHLPTSKHHLRHALFRDTRWYARTDAFRRWKFNTWLAQ